MAGLKETLKTEMEKYAGEGANCRAFAVFDDERQHYAITVVDYPSREDTAGLVLMARIVRDMIVIDEDFTDKKLVDPLLRQGIPRD